MAHSLARVAENDRGRGINETQQIDDGVFKLLRRDPDGPIFDVDMAVRAALHLDALGVALIALGKCGNGFGHGRRKQQRLPFGGCCFENEFEILAKAEVQHLVGFIQNERGQA